MHTSFIPHPSTIEDENHPPPPPLSSSGTQSRSLAKPCARVLQPNLLETVGEAIDTGFNPSFRHRHTLHLQNSSPEPRTSHFRRRFGTPPTQFQVPVSTARRSVRNGEPMPPPCGAFSCGEFVPPTCLLSFFEAQFQAQSGAAPITLNFSLLKP
jgi:hypothetical protein